MSVGWLLLFSFFALSILKDFVNDIANDVAPFPFLLLCSHNFFLVTLWKSQKINRVINLYQWLLVPNEMHIHLHSHLVYYVYENVTICLFEILFVTPRINWRPTHSYQRHKEKNIHRAVSLETQKRKKKGNRRNRHEEWDRNDNLLHTVAILNEFQRLERTRTPERPLNCVLCQSAMLLTHSRCKIWNIFSPFPCPVAFGPWAIHIQTLCAVSIKALIACWQEIMETIFIVDFWLFSNLLHITHIEYERIFWPLECLFLSVWLLPLAVFGGCRNRAKKKTMKKKQTMTVQNCGAQKTMEVFFSSVAESYG